MKCHNPNDPSWLSQQTCWWCGKLGHIHQKCTVSQSEKEAYRIAKLKGTTSANVAGDEPDKYKALVAEEAPLSDIALVASSTEPKPWLIESGCTGHFCLNKSQFVSYIPYTVKCEILLGDARSTPLLGEGTVSLTCIMGEKTATHTIQNIQYVPGLKYGLLSCRVLLHCGLKVVLKDNACKVFHKDGTLVAESILSTTQLFHLRTAPDDPADLAINQSTNIVGPSFDLIHKHLAHPGKDVLEEMIQKTSVLGLDNVQGDGKNFNCEACIQGKMVCAPFQSGHEVADVHLGRVHSDLCGPMKVTSLGKNCYFCMLINDKTCLIWFHPCESKSDFTPWFIHMDKLFVNQYGSHVKILQSDRGGEYVNTILCKYCGENGICLEITVLHTPEQNGVAERTN